MHIGKRMSAAAVKWRYQIWHDLRSVITHCLTRQYLAQVRRVPIALSEKLPAQPTIRNSLENRSVIEDGVAYSPLFDPGRHQHSRHAHAIALEIKPAVARLAGGDCVVIRRSGSRRRCGHVIVATTMLIKGYDQ